jgi:hypothetical protein
MRSVNRFGVVRAKSESRTKTCVKDSDVRFSEPKHE